MSAKPSQVLQIEPPQELVFKGPFTDMVTTQLQLTNPTDKQICFKVKTTAPKQYCVRPNSGLIPAKGVVNVAVMLQPFDLNSEEKSKHKFMVQTAFVPDGESSLENIWKNAAPSDLMDSKLRVVFDTPDLNNAEKIAPTKQTPLKTVSGGADGEAEVRRAQDEHKRLQYTLQQLEQENGQLRSRLSQSESSAGQQQGLGGGSGSLKAASAHQSDANFNMTHVIAAAVVALILGLIFGKIF